jgi:hypothetical protein
LTEAVLDWPAIITAVQTHLEAVVNSAGDVAFQQVFPGEPLGLPVGGPYACFWYLGRVRSDKTGGASDTFGNEMYAARIQIAAFWPIQPERVSLPDMEADIATIDTSIRRELRGDSTINSEVTDLTITDSTVSYGSFPAGGTPQLYRSLMFELHLDNLEGEAIAP